MPLFFRLRVRYTKSIPMQLNSRHLSSLLVIVIIISIPVLIWAERAAGSQWTKPFISLFETKDPNRHTPRFTNGRILPARISTNTTLTAQQGPYILDGETVITPNATLTIEPGVTIFTQEFASLVVYGQLKARGSSDQPIVFDTNELHPDNQTWGGVVFLSKSQGDVAYVTMAYGSPAISCLSESRVSVDSSKIESPIVGLYTESSSCHVTNSRVISPKNGIIAVGVDFNNATNEISAGSNTVLTVAKKAKN